MFAGQAAVALDNARRAEGLEKAVAERTTELEGRVNELAIISRIQQGMASKLDFQGIVDLVGDTLREEFRLGDLGIRWVDKASDHVLYLYEYEHGKRLDLPPTPVRRDRPLTAAMLRGETVVMSSRAEMAKWDLNTIEGTDQSKSCLFAPIIGTSGTVGSIVLENYERENAYGEAAVRLITTIASSMGVALENASRFDETQGLLKETEQRAAELAVINSIQQGISSKLDFQAIVDLTGDKLREVFHTGDLSIRWWERETSTVRGLYAYEHGTRLPLLSVPLRPGSPSDRALRERVVVAVNTRAESDAHGPRAFYRAGPHRRGRPGSRPHHAGEPRA